MSGGASVACAGCRGPWPCGCGAGDGRGQTKADDARRLLRQPAPPPHHRPLRGRAGYVFYFFWVEKQPRGLRGSAGSEGVGYWALRVAQADRPGPSPS
jgi:hypothetical protein